MLTKRSDCSNSDGAVKKENKEKRRRRRSSSEKRTVSLIYKTRSLDKEAEELRNQIKDLDKRSSSNKKISPKSAKYTAILKNGTSHNSSKEISSSPNPYIRKDHQSRNSPALSPVHCSSPGSSSASSSSSSGSDSDSSSVSITAPDLNAFDNSSPSRKKQRVRRKVVVNSEGNSVRPKVELNFDSIEAPEDGELSDEHFSRTKGAKVEDVKRVSVYNGDSGKMASRGESRENKDGIKARKNSHRLPTWLRKSIGFNNEVMSLIDKQDLAGLYQIVKENYESLQLNKQKMELKWAIEKLGNDPENENYKLALDHYRQLDTKHDERLEAAYHKDMRFADIRKVEDKIKARQTKQGSLNSISPELALPDLRSSIRNPPQRSPPLPHTAILAAPYRERPATHCRYEERREVVHRREEIIHRGYEHADHRRGYGARSLPEDKLRRNSYEARAYPAY